MKIKVGYIRCPGWMDKPLMAIIFTAYVLFVLALAVVYSPWFLLMALFLPSFKRDKNKRRGYEKG